MLKMACTQDPRMSTMSGCVAFTILCGNTTSAVEQCAMYSGMPGILGSNYAVSIVTTQLCNQHEMPGCSGCRSFDSCPRVLTSLGRICNSMYHGECGPWVKMCRELDSSSVVTQAFCGAAHGVFGDDEAFCTGLGVVMMSGFQKAFGAQQPCVLFLFKGWVVDTAGKYAAALLGAFAMGVANEGIGFSRKMFRNRYIGGVSIVPFRYQVVFACMHGTQMIWAYWMMLLVMLYEYVLLTALLLGLSVGFYIFNGMYASSILASCTCIFDKPLTNDLEKRVSGRCNGSARDSVHLENNSDASSCAHTSAPFIHVNSDNAGGGSNGRDAKQSPRACATTHLEMMINTQAPCCGGSNF